jgi:alkylation response protein AidB-like acyl-CoA dehydrogenase
MALRTSTSPPDPFSLPALPAAIREQAQELAGRFAERAREVRLYGLEHDQIEPELWREFSEHGWPGLVIPEEHGGSEGGLLGLVVVLEALAASSLVLWMPVLSSAIAHAIATVGPDSAREQWLGRIALGEVQLALAVTEPSVGHNVFRSQTTVLRDGNRFLADARSAGLGRAHRDDRRLPGRATRAIRTRLSGACAQLHRPARPRPAQPSLSDQQGPISARQSAADVRDSSRDALHDD